jgi:hypothetical protein
MRRASMSSPSVIDGGVERCGRERVKYTAPASSLLRSRNESRLTDGQVVPCA